MQNRISIQQHIHFGKPCIAGTRIKVKDVLELVREGISFETIINEYYPDLTPADIQACIQYAMDVVDVEELHLATAS